MIKYFVLIVLLLSCSDAVSQKTGWDGINTSQTFPSNLAMGTNDITGAGSVTADEVYSGGELQRNQTSIYNASIDIIDGRIVIFNSTGRIVASGIAGTDDAVVINSVVGTLPSSSRIWVNPHRYWLNQSISIIQDGLTFDGPITHMYSNVAARFSPLNDLPNGIFYVHGSEDPWLMPNQFTLNKISLDGADRAYNTTGIKLFHAMGINIIDCNIKNIDGAAIDFDKVDILRVIGTTIEGCGNSSAFIPAITWRITSLVAPQNNAVVFDRCIFEPGYYSWFGGTGRVYQFEIKSCYFEDLSLSNLEYGINTTYAMNIHDNLFITTPSIPVINIISDAVDVYGNLLQYGSGSITIDISTYSTNGYPSRLGSVDVHNNFIFDGDGGIRVISTAKDTRIVDNTLSNLNTGISFGTYILVESVVVRGNNIVNCDEGINITLVWGYLSVVENQIRNTANGMIVDMNYLTRLDITGNDFLTCAYPINISGDVPTALVIDNNFGYLTESSGARLLLTGTSQAVAHELAITPTNQSINVVKESEGTDWWFSAAPDATNFYINGTAGKYVDWAIN